MNAINHYTIIVYCILLITSESRASSDNSFKENHLDKILIINDKSASGTGFIVNQEGKSFLYTAIHVISGAKNPSFKSLQGTEITISGTDIVYVSNNEETFDVCRIELKNKLPGFDLGDDIKVDSEVVAYGNSQGQGILNKLPGKIIGIGLGEVEITSQVVPGASGGPLISKSDGKAIGLITRANLSSDIWSAGTSFEGVRRFAALIGNINNWKPVTLNELINHENVISEIQNGTTLLKSVLYLKLKNGKLVYSKRDELSAYLHKKLMSSDNDEICEAVLQFISSSNQELRKALHAQISARPLEETFPAEILEKSRIGDLRGLSQYEKNITVEMLISMCPSGSVILPEINPLIARKIMSRYLKTLLEKCKPDGNDSFIYKYHPNTRIKYRSAIEERNKVLAEIEARGEQVFSE